MAERFCDACPLPASKAEIDSWFGSATKSRNAIRMAASPVLNPSLASARAVACFTLRKAFSTPVSPVVYARPLMRKPITGIRARAPMRLRTEIFELSDLNEKPGGSEDGIARVVLSFMGWPSSMVFDPASGRSG